MSRAAAQDNSNAVSLFPFLAVLLCTMGALLVVLVAVARVSREKGLELAAARKAAAESNPAALAIEDARRRKLDEMDAYVAKLKQVRSQAEARLRDDQARLTHLEEHMRKLQDQLSTLQYSAAELNAMEEEHYDDREQAEREISRLQQLIEETRKTIAELRTEVQSKHRSYAIVPYEGPNGTERRPMYIECRKNEVLLQPEGIQLTPEDFRAPIGPGNPLAAALRAGHEFILREESQPGAARIVDPYPLILVRPDGIIAYYKVREAIESWDSDFGYELVDGDWDLKFPAANPQIASVEQQAVQLARGRMQALAAAAPRAYGAYRSGTASFEFEPDDEGGGMSGGFGRGTASFDDDQFDSHSDGDYGSSGSGGGGGGGGGSNGGDRDLPSSGSDAERIAEQGERESGPRFGQPKSGTAATGSAGSGPNANTSLAADQVTQAGEVTAANGEAATPPGATQGATAAGQAMGSASNSAPSASASAARGTTQSGGSSATAMSSAAQDEDTKAPPSISVSNQETHRDEFTQRTEAKIRGQNWAIRNADPGAIPIRRTIRIIVRSDRLAILPEQASMKDAATAGHEVFLTEPLDKPLHQFVSAIADRIEEWGMAGNGLYWRPVVEVTVGPDGQQRAAQLARLLKNSGIELRTAAVASQNTGDNSGATR